jgi:hypothetical protein
LTLAPFPLRQPGLPAIFNEKMPDRKLFPLGNIAEYPCPLSPDLNIIAVPDWKGHQPFALIAPN